MWSISMSASVCQKTSCIFCWKVWYHMKQSCCYKLLIDERRTLTQKELNHMVASYDSGYMNKKSKPTAITRETINVLTDIKLKESGKCTEQIELYIPNMCCLPDFACIHFINKIINGTNAFNCILQLLQLIKYTVVKDHTNVKGIGEHGWRMWLAHCFLTNEFQVKAGWNSCEQSCCSWSLPCFQGFSLSSPVLYPSAKSTLS